MKPASCRPGDPAGQGETTSFPRPVMVVLVLGGVLVLVSAFLPWFAPVDGSYDLSRSGWGAGPGVVAAVLLGSVPVAVAGAMFMARRMAAGGLGGRSARVLGRRFGTAGRLPGVPHLALAGSLLAGVAIVAVLVTWLSGPTITDPVVPAQATTVVTAAGAREMATQARVGLYLGLAGLVAELAAGTDALRRGARPGNP